MNTLRHKKKIQQSNLMKRVEKRKQGQGYKKMYKRAVGYEEEPNDRGDSVEALSRRRRQECLHRE